MDDADSIDLDCAVYRMGGIIVKTGWRIYGLDLSEPI